MKKGFTLTELLAVIILLGLLLVLVYPRVFEQLEKKEAEIDKHTSELIFSAADQYMMDDLNEFPNTAGKIYYISVETLDQENLIPIEVEDVIDKCVEIKIGSNGNNSYKIVEECK